MIRNKFSKLALYCQRFGFFYGVKVVFAMMVGRKNKIIGIKVPGIKHPVYIRAQSSDEYTFRQIFVNKEYEFRYEGLPKNIVDAGANIGLAAVYFANRFPGCRIVCIEPETGNTQVLKKNIEMYPSISSVQCGLWSKSTYLTIRDEGLGHWGFIVEESEPGAPGAIQAISLPDIMKDHQMESLDIVKMDIEGSEKEVLEAGDVHKWLSLCKVLVIELHDRMKKGTSAALFRALLQYEVEVHQMGENMVCRIHQKRTANVPQPLQTN